MKKNRWLQIVGEMLVELGYPADHVATTLKALDTRPRSGAKHLLSTTEICELLGISRTTLWRLNLPSVIAGQSKRYDIDLVMASLAQNVSDRPKPRGAQANRNIGGCSNE